MEFDWQQPKNNKIFDQLTADSLKDVGTYAMTLIQDGNQIESKMVRTGILDTFIPLDWAAANGTTAEEYEGYLPLQTLNKVCLLYTSGAAGAAQAARLSAMQSTSMIAINFFTVLSSC